MANFLEKFRAFFQQELNDDFVKGSKAFCILPWVHLHITQYGTVTPCCQAPWEESEAFGNINRTSIEEIWNGEAIRAFRKKMMRDEGDKRCKRCYAKEAAGLMSLREVMNRTYKHKLDWVRKTKRNGYSKESQPIYWDIRFSNLCNFRCRICGPWSSSNWASDAKALGYMSKDQPALTRALEDFDSVLSQLEGYVGEVEEVYFAGGEPLLMEEHYRLLDFLIAHKRFDVLLRYNTNFSVMEYKGRSIFDLWNRFDRVMVCASLDDQGKKGEYQRKGQVWEEVLANRQALAERCPNVHFMVSPTVSVLNVLSLPAFHREWVERGFIDVKDFWPNILEQPEYYNVRILSMEVKERVRALYERHVEWIEGQESLDGYVKGLVAKEFGSVVEYMMQEDWRERWWEEFVRRQGELDGLRGEE